MTAEASTARPPGRPRKPECDAAILGATLELLADAGLSGTTIEAVAASAGVGKATIYRRWPNKEALIVDAIDSISVPLPPADSGDLRTDIVALVGAVGRKSGSASDRMLPRILCVANASPELLRRYREGFIEPRRARFREVLRAAVGRGELRGDIDIERAVDLFVGPIVYRRLLTDTVGPLPPEALETFVDDILNGLAPR